MAVVCTYLIISMAYPQFLQAEGFKNRDFLKLNKVQQKAWIGGTVETLWQVAAQKDKSIAQCISDWYYSDTRKRNGLILASAERYPANTPTVILMALTERKCGKYIRN